MRKKIVVLLLVMAVSVSAVAGCGNKMEGEGRVQAAMADAGNAGGKEETEATPEPTAEPTAEPAPEATAEPTAEPSPGATAEPTAEPTPETTAEPAAEPTPDASAQSTKTVAGVGSVEYTISILDELTMYAKDTVNVRDLPDASGKKVGSLSRGDVVTVVGQCSDTGWYQIQYDEKTAYVSDSYLVSEKPKTTTTQQGSSQQGAQGSSQQGSQGQGTSQQGTQSQDTPQQGTQSAATSTSSGQCSALVTYLNQQREAEGIPAVAWDGGLASIAESRAVAISSDFNHDFSHGYSENILGNPSFDESAWFSQWYGSDGHRIAMMHPDVVAVGCAYYEVNGYYWVALIMRTEVKVQTAEEWNETKEERVESGELTEYVSEETGHVSYGTAGGEVVTDQETIDDINEALRAAGLIP